MKASLSLAACKAEAKAFLPFLAAVFPIVLLVAGYPVPRLNEFYYLLRLDQAWHPQLLANDWTFAYGGSEHRIFNFLFGFPTLFLPLRAVGWAGRVLSWILLLHSLYRISKRLGISRFAAGFSIAMWLALKQAPISAEWIFGGFEAKGIAYALLFYAVERGMARRPGMAGLLMGLSFSIHPAVGLWGGLALTASLALDGYTRKEMLLLVGVGFIAALPAAAPLLIAMAGDASSSPEAWRFLLFAKMPFHFDPFTWDKRAILPLYLMLFACLPYFRSRRIPAPHSPRSHFSPPSPPSPLSPARQLVWFMAVSGACFTLGLLFRYTESYGLLKLMPFRVFAVTCPLFFFFLMSQALTDWKQNPLPGAALVAAVLGAMGLGNPLGLLVDSVGAIKKVWTQPAGDYVETLLWMAGNTPDSAIVAMPPWRQENGYCARRAQVASFLFNPYDRLDEWEERLRAQVGEVPYVGMAEQNEAMRAHYAALSEAEVLNLRDRYHAEYLVSETAYPFPLLHASGAWKAYRLPSGSLPPAAPNAP
jgi:hypothetical protein